MLYSLCVYSSHYDEKIGSEGKTEAASRLLGTSLEWPDRLKYQRRLCYLRCSLDLLTLLENTGFCWRAPARAVVANSAIQISFAGTRQRPSPSIRRSKFNSSEKRKPQEQNATPDPLDRILSKSEKNAELYYL